MRRMTARSRPGGRKSGLLSGAAWFIRRDGTIVGVDTTPPTITSANPSGSYAEMAAVSGKLTADEPVSWTVSGADAAAVTLDPQTGDWSLGITDYETKASYSWTFTATDAAGNSTSQNVALVITDLDEIPDAFTFTDVTDATTNTEYVSDLITVAGLAPGVSVPVAVSGGPYSKNGGAYSTAATTAQNGDTFSVKQTSSANNSAATNTVLTIGGVTDTFTVTTVAAPPAVVGGTSPTRYSFASTRFRLATVPRTVNVTTYPSSCCQAVTWSPDYDVTDPVFVFPCFYDSGAGDVAMSGGTITVRSVLISLNGSSNWIEVPGANYEGMVTLDGSTPAWLTPAFMGVTIPANSQVCVRVYFTVSAATVQVPAGIAASNFANSANLLERQTGITVANDGAAGAAWTNRATGLPTAVPPNVNNGQGPFWSPIAMLAKGGDGRPAYLGIGPSSTMYGNDDSVAPRYWTDRGAFGAVDRAFDDNTTIVDGSATQRLTICNFGVPGSRFMDSSTGESYFTGSRYAKKFGTLQLIKDTLGDWPFDKVVAEPLLNNVPGTQSLVLTGLTNMLTDLKNLWGKPIVYNEGDNGGALNAAGDFVAVSPYIYPGDVIWYARGLTSNVSDSDPTAPLRANGLIEESFTFYRGTFGGTDDAGMNTTIAPSGYTATLTAAVTANNQATIQLDNPPSIGMALLYKATDGSWAGMTVTNVVGTTYSVTAGAKPAAAGTAVREGYGTGGVHPSPRTHAMLIAPEVLKYKARLRDAVVAPAAATAQTISPAAAWDGSAQSGYAGAPPIQTGTAVSTSFTGFMNGTKACNLNWLFTADFYPDALFTDDLLVLVDGGDQADAMEVTFFCEGNTAVLSDRSIVDIPACIGYDGANAPVFGTKTVAAYAVKLKNANFGSNGEIDLYAKGHSADPLIADRVIGPVRLFRRTDLGDGKLGYDVMKTVGTGGDYANLAAALAGHTSYWVSGQCVLLKSLNDMTIDPTVNPFTTPSSATKGKRGTVVFDANGFNVKGLRTGNPNLWRPGFNGLVLKGMTFDLSNITQLYAEDGAAVGTNDGFRPLLLNRCTIYGGGKYELAGGSSTVANADAKTIRSVSAWRPEVARLACLVRDMHTGDNQSYIETGSYQVRTSGDLHLVGSSLHRNSAIFYNIYEDCDPLVFRAGTTQFSLYYTGAGTPGYRTTGTWNSSARKFILTVDGTDVDAGITLSTTFGTGVYSSLDLVNAINATYGASGWHATSIADTYRAAMVGTELDTTVKSVGTSAGTATNVPAIAPLHMDGFQFSAYDLHDNHIIKGNELRGVDCQCFFLSIQDQTKNSYNCLIENNGHMLNNEGDATSGSESATLISQISGDHFNLMMRHNTVPNQGILVRVDAYGTNLDNSNHLVNNVFRFLGQTAVASGNSNDAVWSSNISLIAPVGGYLALSGPNVSGNVTGASTPLTDFPALDDPANTLTRSSFNPAIGGTVRANPKAPGNTRDIGGNLRTNPSLCGAIAA